jgi:hypothetical protein
MVSLHSVHSSICYSTDVSPGCVTASAYCSHVYQKMAMPYGNADGCGIVYYIEKETKIIF